MAGTASSHTFTLDRQRAGERWRQVSALHAIQHSPGGNASFALRKSDSALSLVGEMDIACAKDLDVLLDHLMRTTSGDLTFELSGVDFIDVAATRRLAVFRRTMAASGRSLLFRRLSPAARRTFRVFALVEADEL